MASESEQRIWLAAGRMLICERLPYMADAVYFLVPKPLPGLSTFRTGADGIMEYDPALCSRWSVGQLAVVLLHEAMHPLRDHIQRLNDIGAQLDIGNIAADCELNDDIDVIVQADAKAKRNMPLAWPEHPRRVLPEDYGLKRGGLLESYYDALKKKAKPMSVLGVLGGACGSCAQPGTAPAAGEAGRTGARTAVEAEVMRQAVAQAVQDAAARGDGRGSVPAGLLRWAQRHLRPAVIPWRTKLRRAVRQGVARQQGSVLPTWRRFSRHQAGIGYGPGRPMMPSLFAPQSRVMVALDTSGSMGEAQLTAGLSEIDGVLKATGASVTFCACDSAVHTLQQVRTTAELARLVKGGGGTSFVPIFQAAAKTNPRVHVLILLTDGDGDAPHKAPDGITVIWVLTGKQCKAPADWGEAINIDTDGE